MSDNVIKGAYRRLRNEMDFSHNNAMPILKERFREKTPEQLLEIIENISSNNSSGELVNSSNLPTEQEPSQETEEEPSQETEQEPSQPTEQEHPDEGPQYKYMDVPDFDNYGLIYKGDLNGITMKQFREQFIETFKEQFRDIKINEIKQLSNNELIVKFSLLKCDFVLIPDGNSKGTGRRIENPAVESSLPPGGPLLSTVPESQEFTNDEINKLNDIWTPEQIQVFKEIMKLISDFNFTYIEENKSVLVELAELCKSDDLDFKTLIISKLKLKWEIEQFRKIKQELFSELWSIGDILKLMEDGASYTNIVDLIRIHKADAEADADADADADAEAVVADVVDGDAVVADGGAHKAIPEAIPEPQPEPEPEPEIEAKPTRVKITVEQIIELMGIKSLYEMKDEEKVMRNPDDVQLDKNNIVTVIQQVLKLRVNVYNIKTLIVNWSYDDITNMLSELANRINFNIDVLNMYVGWTFPEIKNILDNLPTIYSIDDIVNLKSKEFDKPGFEWLVYDHEDYKDVEYKKKRKYMFDGIISLLPSLNDTNFFNKYEEGMSFTEFTEKLLVEPVKPVKSVEPVESVEEISGN